MKGFSVIFDISHLYMSVEEKITLSGLLAQFGKVIWIVVANYDQTSGLSFFYTQPIR